MLRTLFVVTSLIVLSAQTAHSREDWEGEFVIRSSWNSLAVDVPEGRSEEGLAVIQWELHGRDAQKWRVEAVDAPRGWYKIVNAFTGKVLDIRNASKKDRAILVQSEWKGAKSQHWRIDKQADGSYKILSRWSGKAIDIPYGSKEQGTKLELCEDNNQPNQRWEFRKVTK